MVVAGGEHEDAGHSTTAALGAAWRLGVGRRIGRRRLWGGEEPTAQFELGAAAAVGEEAVVTDAYEPFGQEVEEETCRAGSPSR